MWRSRKHATLLYRFQGAVIWLGPLEEKAGQYGNTRARKNTNQDGAENGSAGLAPKWRNISSRMLNAVPCLQKQG